MNCIRSEVIFLSCLLVSGLACGMDQQNDQQPIVIKDTIVNRCFYRILQACAPWHTNRLLHHALFRGDIVTLKTLLAASCDVNATTDYGETLLLMATEKDDLVMIEILLEAGANVNAANQLGITPLYRAVWHGYAGVVKVLLAAGADVHTVTQTGVTLLQKAADHGDEIVNMLIEAGAE